MITLLDNKFFVIFFAPLILGVLTIFGFSPYNFTLVNFFTFPILLFFIFLIKKKNFIFEFDKVWVHGFLHLLGYNHIKNKDYFKMNKFEKRILNSI